MKRIIKRILLALSGILIILSVIYWDLLFYGILQGRGQLTIVWNAKPVENFLSDSEFPDSLKTKLRLIGEVRKFAIDSLGLKDTDNYKTLYDQKGEEIMWVVTACEPFKFAAKEWSFPIVGSFPYKGFFDKEKARAELNKLKEEGWDVSVRNPGGWSTLGWFTDPILSKMLERSDGDLANLIIHEMTHATLFVKDSVEFNENLASFIGDLGAVKFLEYKFGKNSREANDHITEETEYKRYVVHMLRGYQLLDSVYNRMNDQQTPEEKKKLKEAAILSVVEAMDTLSFKVMKNPSSRLKEYLPNNTYFINFRRYEGQQDFFKEECASRFQNNLKHYIHFLKSQYLNR